jgi:aminobenzoyl-glutamate utilization protein B
VEAGLRWIEESTGELVALAQAIWEYAEVGREPNVVPPCAEVWYYIRAPRRQDVDEIYQRIVKIAEGASLMTGARLEIKFQTGVREPLPNSVATAVLEESLRRAGPPQFTEE